MDSEFADTAVNSRVPSALTSNVFVSIVAGRPVNRSRADPNDTVGVTLTGTPTIASVPFGRDTISASIETFGRNTVAVRSACVGCSQTPVPVGKGLMDVTGRLPLKFQYAANRLPARIAMAWRPAAAFTYSTGW